jgi:membrane protein
LKRVKKEQIWGAAGVAKAAFAELLRNDPLRMAGATAFFTTFALPPILVILIQILRLFVNPQTISQELFGSLKDIVGAEAVQQIISVLQSLLSLANNWPMTIAGFVFLLFVATTLFRIINGSLNQLWNIIPLKTKTLGLRTRLKSMLVIVIAGILFMVGLVAEAAQAFVGSYIFNFSPVLSFYFNSILNQLITFLIVMLWFAMLFRYLPDGRPSWKNTFYGALVTALLFSVGRILLRILLSYSNINTLYGTSASIVLLLLFVFYSSLILYYGASFTKVWSEYRQQPIRPLSHARHYKMVEEQ